jgi:beta-galactosidase/beta-glucuronidase
MRKISLGVQDGSSYLFLNNKALFHYGPLDQGWWPDGLLTPPSDEAMKYDIEITKAMGFNMIRKHIKVEPARWYYYCDKLGMLVWQDMPSGMVVLPGKDADKPVHVQHVPRNGDDLQVRSADAQQYELELRRLIDSHYNSPAIVIWVPFNEGWGQYATCRIANAVKQLDPTRLVDAVTGWALRPCGDMYDIHTYQTEVNVPPVSLDRASVIGEYGGIGYPVKDHLWNPEMRNWGYQTYQSAEELLKNYVYKFNQIVEMKKSKGLSAAVYTQTTDVEGEVNGLMTYDRKVIKIPVEKLKEIHSALFVEKK